MGVVQALDEPRYIAWLHCPVMDDQPTLGQALLAAVIPSRFKDLNALHLASRIAYSTVHKWKTGEANPRWEQVCAIADLVHENPFRLVSGADVGDRAPRISDHPLWGRAVERALDRFPGRVPERFYAIAGAGRAASMPEIVDENFAFELAQFWWKYANNHELSQADTAAAQGELEELRASTKRQTR